MTSFTQEHKRNIALSKKRLYATRGYIHQPFCQCGFCKRGRRELPPINKGVKTGKPSWNSGKKMSTEFCAKVSLARHSSPNHRKWPHETTCKCAACKAVRGERVPWNLGKHYALKNPRSTEWRRKHSDRMKKLHAEGKIPVKTMNAFDEGRRRENTLRHERGRFDLSYSSRERIGKAVSEANTRLKASMTVKEWKAYSMLKAEGLIRANQRRHIEGRFDLDTETWAMIREKLKQTQQTPQYRTRLSTLAKSRWENPECRTRYALAIRKGWDNPKAREKASKSAVIRKRTHKFPTRNTDIELKLQTALTSANVLFETDVPLFNVTRADIAIRLAKVAIFADGCIWHHCAECGFGNGLGAREQRQNAVLLANDWLPLRYWGHELKTKAQVKQVLDEILNAARPRMIQELNLKKSS